ncbi:LysR family transcriptional regulator [Herbaspirillum lusitanum]|uniref:LysR family transcriptional regulator n=1 Tax=Herbaspirillum lusitanum TaxID=213312 RepID=A0ABW9AGZ9_9BURK
MDRLDAMKVFCTVVETGGFSKAAEKLGVSTSSVTNQVAGLESLFNIKLLNRTTRSMSVTEEGQRCYDTAQQLLADMSMLEDELTHSHATPKGTLHVGMSNVAARQYIGPELPRFMAMYPEIKLRLTVSDHLVDMVEAGIDVLIRVGHAPNANMVAKQIMETSFICCAAPSYLEKYGWPDTPDKLGEYQCLNFISPNTGQLRTWVFEKDGQRIEHLPQAAAAADHVETLIEMAKAGGGLIQQLSPALLPYIRTGALVPILREWEMPAESVWVLFPPRHHRAAKVKAFVDFVQDPFNR